MCGVPLDNWGNGGYDDVLFTYGDCSLSSFGSWSTHSKFPALFCLRIKKEIFKKMVVLVVDT